MICPKCEIGEMEILDVLVCKTTDPQDDDIFRKMYVCPECNQILPIYPEEEDYEGDN